MDRRAAQLELETAQEPEEARPPQASPVAARSRPVAQPEILIVDHDGIQGPWDADLVMYEEPKGVFSPTGNTIAAAQDNKINGTGGNDWYWAPDIGNLMTASAIVDGHLKKLEASYTNFILNCPPNRDGQLDAAIMATADQGSILRKERRTNGDPALGMTQPSLIQGYSQHLLKRRPLSLRQLNVLFARHL